MASQGALVAKNPGANAGDLRDTGSIPGSGRCPGKETATHPSILAWRIPWIEEPGGATVQFSSVAQSCPTLCNPVGVQSMVSKSQTGLSPYTTITRNPDDKIIVAFIY